VQQPTDSDYGNQHQPTSTNSTQTLAPNFLKKNENMSRTSSPTPGKNPPNIVRHRPTNLPGYHAFRDQKNIDEVARGPANSDLIMAFVSAMAGSPAGSTINNYISDTKSWIPGTSSTTFH
jgi:hypothetical protein